MLRGGAKGQVEIPKILREEYGIGENDHVLVEAREGELAVLRALGVEEVIAGENADFDRAGIRGLRSRARRLRKLQGEAPP